MMTTPMRLGFLETLKKVKELLCIDLSGNGNDGIINGATCSVNVPNTSCQLTTINVGCDSTAVSNLTITQPDTSISLIWQHVIVLSGMDKLTLKVECNTAYVRADAIGCDSVVTLDLSH